MIIKSATLVRNVTVCILLVSTMACKPYAIAYRHLCVEEALNMKLIKKSDVSNNSQGEPLKWPKIGLPLEMILENPEYIVTIYTPLANRAVVFLNIQSTSQTDLTLSGPNINRVDIDRPDVKYMYDFDVNKANGDPIRFSIFTTQGRCLGVENLKYKIITRGYAVGIEAL